MRYGSAWGPLRKNFSANAVTVILDEDEYITGIEGYFVVHCISFHLFTNKNNYGPYGTHPTNGLTKKHCLPGDKLAYISGRRGDVFDILNFHFVNL